MNTAIESFASTDDSPAGDCDVLIPRWISSQQEALKAATSVDKQIVWIIKNAHLVNSVAHQIAAVRTLKKAGYLILLSDARLTLIPALEKRFAAVAFTPRILSKEEFQDVWSLRDRKDRFIGGIVDDGSKTVTLWRGNLESITVPFDAFPPTANGIRPDFKRFSIIEYGQTLKFGDYESDSEPILFEFAPDFRRRLKQIRFAEEQTLGASIRRLRRQKRKTRRDFANIDPKTIARIEEGKIKAPRASTLEVIAETLGVKQSELGDY
jgi:DNA-binding Xre family transcriptional regulator